MRRGEPGRMSIKGKGVSSEIKELYSFSTTEPSDLTY